MTPEETQRRLARTDDPDERQVLLLAALAGSDRGAFLIGLKAASEQQLNVDVQAALRLAEALILAGTCAEEPRHVAFGLLAKADVLRTMGHFGDAVELFDAAALRFEHLGDRVAWARTRIGWLYAVTFLGRAEEGLAEAARARDILVAQRQWLRAAGLTLHAAIASCELGQFERALSSYDEALDFFARAAADDPSLTDAAAIRSAKARANKARVLLLLGEFEPALELHRQARATFAEHGEAASVLRQDHFLAEVFAGQARYTAAARLYVDVLAEAERSGLDADVGWIGLNLVATYLALNRHREALALAEEIVERCERRGNRVEAAKARFAAALAQAGLGRRDQAHRQLELAAREFVLSGLTAQLGLVALEQAGLRLREQDWSAALDKAARARSLFVERGLVPRATQATLLQARALLALDELAAASQLAASALDTAHERGLMWLLHDGHHVLAGVAAAREDLPTALAECDRAVSSIERVQSRLAIELRSHFQSDKLAVYRDALDFSLRLGQADQALDYLERAKSRSLVDYLARTPDVNPHLAGESDPLLVEELARLRAEHNWFTERLHGDALGRPPDQGRGEHDAALTDAERARLTVSIEERERQIARLLERMALHAAGDGDPAWNAQLVGRPHLDDDTVLLEYALLEQRSVAFVLYRRGLEVVSLPARPVEIGRLLQRWQLNLDAAARALAVGAELDGLGRNARGLLEAFYRALVLPVAQHLAGYKRLIVVPFGPLHWVPFHALHDGRGFLLESFEVAVCPSSSLLRLCAERAERAHGHSLVVGYSQGGRLPYVLDEARAVAAQLDAGALLEEQATCAAVTRAAAGAAVLHLAAHGEARLDNPSFAHLKLAGGQLSATDVFNLQLDGALVTLSACETGRAVIVGGDELIGLTRGFLYAGAATLVQSLWRVEDGSTAHLMERFYSALKAGRSKGAALRLAQRELQARYPAHPYLWAPFQLVGDAGPLPAVAAGRAQGTTLARA